MPKKKTREEFIKEATEKHEGKYDYSKVEYVNNRKKVCIICPKPEHGEFWQVPSSHLSGCGCPKCYGKYAPTTEEWIVSAHKVHGDKYDYSKVKYVDAKTKVCIKCTDHGEFWQLPSNHLRGQGCPTCRNEANSKRFRLSKEGFIKKANEVHGDKYNYSKVRYENNETKVCIKCTDHGEFWQNPNGHLNGRGCLKCVDKYVPTTEEWIEKARKVHGNNYNYSKVHYVNCMSKVCIICSKHGKFWQTPSNHLHGKGCPKCNLSHLERDVMNYLDGVGITYIYQKHFDWLGRQSLDFYLPDYNVGIECQGGQHFFPVDFAGKGVEWACKEFNKLVSRDKKKKTLCEKHGVKLLYFGNVPNYDTFLGEVVHDDVQYLIDYLNEHKINGN